MHLMLVGDVMLGRLVNDALRVVPPSYPWGDTLPLFQSADFRICNLECVVADVGMPWSATPKAFHFRSDVKNVDVLRAVGVNAVSLANNHTLDYGFDALAQMLDTLDGAGILHAGAGRTHAEAMRAAIAEVVGERVGLLAFTDNEPEWAATAERPGVFYVPAALSDPRAAHLLEVVRRTKERVDMVIVSAHWGPNWGYTSPHAHPPFAHALIDAGADVVFGHSGHVMRGVEVYRQRPILYCAGDFIDDYAVDEVERNDESAIFWLEMGAKGVRKLRAYPTVIRDFQARMARGDEAEVIAKKLRRLCTGLDMAAVWRHTEGYLDILPP